MQISLLVRGNPFECSSCSSALEFAKAVLGSNHGLFRIFFYKDAVLIANKQIEIPVDEFNLQHQWQKLHSNYDVDLTVCVSASQRRGVTQETLADGFEISGLGQLVEAMLEADRLVVF